MFKTVQHKQTSSPRSKDTVNHRSSLPFWEHSYLKPLKKISRRFSPYWFACIPLSAIIFIAWNSAVHAQDTATPPTVEELQGTLNAIWVLVASILVIFMNAGFAMLETGFCRQKNAVNILSKNLIVFALATIAYWVIGYSLMFGASGSGFIGFGGLFLQGTHENYGLAPFPEGLPLPLHFLFQSAFAGTAATIVSGAVAERIKFTDFLIFSIVLVGIAYPITGHWIWGGGILSKISFLTDGEGNPLGVKDFAGSLAVHSVGGWAALVGASILGPRSGKYTGSRINALPGHNMSIATLGCLILWVCWFGFNAGSTLSANETVPYIAVTTNLAGAIGGIVATFTSWVKDGKPDLSMIINGILAGLVGITAGCDGVTYWGSIWIGAIAGFIVVFAVSFFDRIRIDDPVGATSVHLVCGIWGTLAVGLFNKDLGLFYGGGINQFIAQILGILTVGGFTVVVSFITWYVLKATLGIRVSQEEEQKGLDIGEHGMEAYSGFVKEADVLFGGAAGGISGSEEAIER
jgi:ammonium transporter, Amt family